MLRPQVLSGGLKIEPDRPFLPRPTGHVNGYPSFVVGVGDVNPLCNLQTHACLWLDNTHGLTRVVLILAISESSPDISFDR